MQSDSLGALLVSCGSCGKFTSTAAGRTLSGSRPAAFGICGILTRLHPLTPLPRPVFETPPFRLPNFSTRHRRRSPRPPPPPRSAAPAPAPRRAICGLLRAIAVAACTPIPASESAHRQQIAKRSEEGCRPRRSARSVRKSTRVCSCQAPSSSSTSRAIRLGRLWYDPLRCLLGGTRD
jgi:hypothetical protein